jgi:hypothetical protein
MALTRVEAPVMVGHCFKLMNLSTVKCVSTVNHASMGDFAMWVCVSVIERPVGGGGRSR